jgi:hypothetical protein
MFEKNFKKSKVFFNICKLFNLGKKMTLVSRAQHLTIFVAKLATLPKHFWSHWPQKTFLLE